MTLAALEAEHKRLAAKLEAVRRLQRDALARWTAANDQQAASLDTFESLGPAAPAAEAAMAQVWDAAVQVKNAMWDYDVATLAALDLEASRAAAMEAIAAFILAKPEAGPDAAAFRAEAAAFRADAGRDRQQWEPVSKLRDSADVGAARALNAQGAAARRTAPRARGRRPRASAAASARRGDSGDSDGSGEPEPPGAADEPPLARLLRAIRRWAP